MGKPKGFLAFGRKEPPHRSVESRVGDFLEIEIPLSEDEIKHQATRCMECGIPFCHGIGCPVKNYIPEFNDLVYQNRWREACEVLHATNNFPEITGRVCPAPCEAACTLNLNDAAVSIKHIEYLIAERGFSQDWIVPLPAATKTGKRIGIVGSGPAGLTAAQQLARLGHEVVVFEKDERPGGLLRYGIPDFKLDKRILDRRLEQLRAEGVHFETGLTVGEDLSARYLQRTFDAVVLTMGAGVPRRLKVPGCEYENVHFALDFLRRQNRIVSGETVPPAEGVIVKDKIVVVIGGGDTGSDCVGTARRLGAKEIHQLEILPRPPETRPADTPWPNWPRILRTSSSHEEGCTRRWSVMTEKITGKNNRADQLHGIEVQWRNGPTGYVMKEVLGTEFTMKVDVILLAMGFLHVEPKGLVAQFGLDLDKRGNILVDDYQTSAPNVFAAGDALLGASLVVRAIDTARQAARAIHSRLMEESEK